METDIKINNIKVGKIKWPEPKEVKEIKIILIAKCPFCEKMVRGTNQNQLDWNMALHIKQKHGNDEEARILLEQLEDQEK